MDFLISIWEFFQNNILTKPEYFFGFIVLIGNLILKRPIFDAIAEY